MSRIAFLFPGQGAQDVGMGRDMFGRDPFLDELVDRGIPWDEVYAAGMVCLSVVEHVMALKLSLRALPLPLA